MSKRGRIEGALLQGLLAVALQAQTCSSLSATASTGLFAGHSAGLPSATQLASEASAGWGGKAAAGLDEDSVQNEIKLHLGQIDDLINHMSQFQVRVLGSRIARNPAQCLPAPAHSVRSLTIVHSGLRQHRRGVQCWRVSWRSVHLKTIALWPPLNPVSPVSPAASVCSVCFLAHPYTPGFALP